MDADAPSCDPSPPPSSPPAAASASSSNATSTAASTHPSRRNVFGRPPAQVATSSPAADRAAQNLPAFDDPDTADTHSGTVDWGDGDPIDALIVDQGAASGSSIARHAYDEDVTYRPGLFLRR